ncbi:Ppx/GppA phosphatase family protein [Namhaeicola litoreus]|uniref:Exopolyphosphatase n=1 Tax=Namhaeicola litoreus TaxID=1052145 RepID=A0ABW3Y140_9FLAO
MFIRKYGAIDIGSNGVRLLISNIIEFDENQTEFKKSALIRVPIRLGEDVFNTGKISEKNIQRMSDAMNSFRLIMRVYGVEKFKACATSAMREAKNSKSAVKRIFENSQIKIEVIDGQKEAEIISYTELHTLLKSNRSYLYVDVGGGSTEFTFFSKGKKINARSFPLGTVRILDGKVDQNTWSEAEDWIKENSSSLKNLSLIGSGGNINKLYKMSGKLPGKYLDIKYLENYYNFLSNMTYEERISKLDLNPDRADVIVPAAKIYLNALQWCQATKIYVPKFGLSDGIIRGLYANKLS